MGENGSDDGRNAGLQTFGASPRPNWRLRIAAATGVMLATGGLVYLLLCRGSVPAALRDKPAVAQPPARSASVSAPVPIPRAAPAVVRGPEPTGPPGPFALKADTKYDLKVRVSSVIPGASAPGKVRAAFQIELNGKGDKTLLRSLGKVAIRKLVLDSGAAITCDATGRFSGGAGRYFSCILTEVPDDTRWLREVEGAVTIHHAKKRETLVWEEPLACRGQARTAGAITITLVDYQQDATSARAVIQVKAPPARHMGTRDEEFFLGGGTYRRPIAGSGGRAPGGGDQWNLSATLNNLTPKTLEADLVSEVETEEAPFRLENVALPALLEPAPAAGTPRLPRQPPVQCSAQGFTLWVESVELHAGDRPSVGGKCMAAANPGVSAHFANLMAMQTKALYNTGAAATGTDDPVRAEHWMPMHKGRLCFAFSFPPPPGNAARFASLAGIYRAFVADESKTAEFTLPKPGENVTEPLSQGPVTLLSVTCANDIVVVTCAVDVRATLTGKNWPALADITAFDGHGASLKRTGGRQDRPGERVVVTSTFAAGQGKLARVVVSYVTKGGIREIPFEFKDVDLPRKTGKIEFRAPDF